MRLFKREARPDGCIEEWYSEPDGTIHRKVIQPAQNIAGVQDAVKMAAPFARGKNQYYLGSVPLVLAQQWAKECGHAVGTRDFAEFAKKKLMDGEYSSLSTGIRV